MSHLAKLHETVDTSGACETVTDNGDVPWFCCLDEARRNRSIFPDENYSKKNTPFIFGEEAVECNIFTDADNLNLFEFNFDKGTAVIEELSDIFKMARYSYMQLEYTARTSLISVTVGIMNRRNSSCISYRREIARFLLYLNDYIRRIGSCSRFDWLRGSLFKKISSELDSFLLFCGEMNNLPDHIVNSNAKTMCNEPSYHAFHCLLDVKWLHITLLRQLIAFEENQKDGLNSQESYLRSTNETLDKAISNLISELICIALKRFQHISTVDLSVKSIFSCPCVKKLWGLLQITCDELNSQERSGSFWTHVNRVCDELRTQNGASTTTTATELNFSQKYGCSNPGIFIFWLLKHLTSVYEVKDCSATRSNYQLLENNLKSFLKSEASELETRVVLLLVEKILKNKWEERTEPLVLLWEYFHKRMNSLFLVPGAPISEMAIMGKNASGILKNLTKKLESTDNDEHMTSFHLFLRLLGVKVKKWRGNVDGLRCWNQLKGRLLSKFSASKFSTFNETGLYHFILVFLTLAVSADLQEMGDKLQMSLQILRQQELNETRTKLILEAYMALIFLFIQHDRDISSLTSSLLAFIEVLQNHPQNVTFMRVFSEEFRDLVGSTDDMQLGQHTLIGNWIPTFLSTCSESEANCLLDSILLLVTKLNSAVSSSLPITEDSKISCYGDSLWDHLVPYLKTISLTVACPYQISDIVAVLTELFIKLSALSKNRTRAAELFTYFIGRENMDTKILCRYVGQIHLTGCINNRDIFGNHNIVLIRSWLRCLILLPEDENREHLLQFTLCISSIPELQHMLPKDFSTMFFQNDFFETLLAHLQSKYFSCENLPSKNKLVNQFSNYFTYADKWLSHALKSPVSTKSTLNIYRNVGRMFDKIPQMLYTKSKSNSLLQNFLDLLLLSTEFRNPQTNIPQHVIAAINKTIHLYLHGLFVLDPENDIYIERCIRELIITYVPRLISPRGNIFALGNATETSILKCFENNEHFDLISKTILGVLCNAFLKKRTKLPHQSAFQALVFFDSLIKQYKNDDRVVISFMKCAFDRICDVVMFCDISNPCRKKAKDIVTFVLNLESVRNSNTVSSNTIDAFGRLCQEHLAFTSRNLFDLFDDIVRVAPDLVLRFLPQFTIKIKEIENKRGVGYDRTLRKGLERIEDALRNIRGDVRNDN